MKKRLAILGSTGSIGRNALEVVGMHPDRFSVVALTGCMNIDLLARQIERFAPEMAVVRDAAGAAALKDRLAVVPMPGNLTRILYGKKGYIEAALHPEADIVVSAIVGAAGLMPTLAAISAGKDIALANKETLVMAGDIVMKRAKAKGVAILPVDSEHSAIFQCLSGNRRQDLKRILLTASGGPFLTRNNASFDSITPADALVHPTWNMGEKISIDSATLMNKGLEVIEAMHLFGVGLSEIEVVIHPESIVHSMVAFTDGAVIAQMGVPDMKGAIAYALSFPERIDVGLAIVDFAKIASLTFEKPDLERFPALTLARNAARSGGTAPCVLNAANEVAVDAFLRGVVSFTSIPALIEKTLEAHNPLPAPDIDAIMDADLWARNHTASLVRHLRG
ncbi:MAG: 1-deoxy-D-xylulose-5-phosphate reductoisomerase [Deltaproteobacteria bacterium]|nr:1-deoxy-D-xylulose-5-phosphate reductoisomerase [Deltaproteobacteria bacterium]